MASSINQFGKENVKVKLRRTQTKTATIDDNTLDEWKRDEFTPNGWVVVEIDGAPHDNDLISAVGELLEVGHMRGDDELPHPADDANLWTARMQTAWDDLRHAYDQANKE